MAIEIQNVSKQFQDTNTYTAFINTFRMQITQCEDGNDISKVTKAALLILHPDKYKGGIKTDEVDELVKKLTSIKDETQGKTKEKALKVVKQQLGIAATPTPDQASPSSTPVSSELHDAAMRGDTNKVETLLLGKNVDVNAIDVHGNTPLHWAAQFDRTAIAVALIEKGANVHATNKNGHTPLLLAIDKGNLDIVKQLITAGAKVNDADRDGRNPLCQTTHTSRR